MSTDPQINTVHNMRINTNETPLIQSQNSELKTTSQFNLATPHHKKHNTNNTQTPSPSSPSKETIKSPAIPNSAFRNLNIATPGGKNAEQKEIETIGKTAEVDSIICDENAYIATVDNKRLQKIAEIDPNKTYNRIQVQNLNKLKKNIRSTIDNMMERKRKKLLEKKKQSSDKQEIDETHDANAQIPNEHKLDIIEKALNACYTQLIYFNKLFLNPIAIPDLKENTDKEQLSEHKKKQRMRINEIKKQIEEKRQLLIQRIESLSALRNRTISMDVNVPQDIKDKMIQNREMNEGNQNKEKMEIDIDIEEKERKTRNILSMIHQNKKKKMLNLKAKFAELKENEMNLKQRAKKITNDEEKFRQYMELKRKNEEDMRMNGDYHDNNKGKQRKDRMSVASAISSTIHGPVSPLSMFDKFCAKSFNNKLSVSAIKQCDVFNDGPL